MNKHFAYLTQNDEADFFQKVATEQAESRMPAASMTLMKTAMQNLLEGVTFEKVAARLDRDIYILKTAGESGMNMGMQKRAGAYIDQLVEQCEMTPEEFDQIFEKVAGEAIMGDLVVAQAHLSEGLDDDGLAWLNGELTKIGAELTELALMEKEAFWGAALRALGAGAKSIVGGGARAAAKGVGGAAKAVGRTVAAPFRGAANLAGKAPGAIRDWRISRGTKSLAKTEASLAKMKDAQKALASQGKGGGVLGGGRDAAIKSMEKSVEKGRAHVGQLTSKKMQAEGSRLVQGANPASPKGNTWTTLRASKPTAGSPTAATDAAKAAKPPSTPDAKLPQFSADESTAWRGLPDQEKKDKIMASLKGRGIDPGSPKGEQMTAKAMKNADEATKGATPPPAPKTEAPPPSTAKDTKADDLTLNATKGDGVTLKGSWEKMRDGGWKSLSGEEKQKLINAGVATVVGGRVITGHGILTGGEGII